jgi:hypothetical protein
MAITQGINGTFSPIHYDEPEIVHFGKLKKTVPDGKGGWEERVFYTTTKNVASARQWLQQKYGEAKYCQTWWYAPDKVVMSEKIYTHYSLSV